MTRKGVRTFFREKSLFRSVCHARSKPRPDASQPTAAPDADAAGRLHSSSGVRRDEFMGVERSRLPSLFSTLRRGIRDPADAGWADQPVANPSHVRAAIRSASTTTGADPGVSQPTASVGFDHFGCSRSRKATVPRTPSRPAASLAELLCQHPGDSCRIIGSRTAAAVARAEIGVALLVVVPGRLCNLDRFRSAAGGGQV